MMNDLIKGLYAAMYRLFLIHIIILCGCVAQQSDLKQTEKVLQQELSQTRARQGQEITTLREYELPQLRGEVEKVLHQTQELQARHEEIALRLDSLEKQKETHKTDLIQRMDSLDLVVGKILLRMEEVERRLQGKEKR
ncbi:MAG: hypothetical protein NDI90_11275 [Nitrospira sp. BO4]|jgi:septal ring factor EnvC (AmiA/AmiB activator)|nr:hypothetical protein [Nitrospira sp. BO4]